MVIKIYMVIGPSGKLYVGQTKHSLQKRLNQHEQNGRGYINRAIHAHGIEAFRIFELDKCESKNEADEKERSYIKKFHSLRTDIPGGYNLTKGGEGGDTFSQAPDEEKRRRAAIFGAARLGKKHTEEAKRKIGSASRGKKHTQEAIQKCRKAGFKPGNIPWIKGKTHTEEARRKIGDAKRGDKSPMKRTEVVAKILATRAANRAAKNLNIGINQPPLF